MFYNLVFVSYILCNVLCQIKGKNIVIQKYIVTLISVNLSLDIACYFHDLVAWQATVFKASLLSHFFLFANA